MSQDQPFTDLPGVELGVEHGLPAVRVSTNEATGLVYLQGAHVAAWQPRGRDPVIFMSERAVYAPGKALRGGVPICFPWFGAHAEHKDYPAHGFARSRNFEYEGARSTDTGHVELGFTLQSDAETRKWFPYEFVARLRVAFGATLGLYFSVINRDSKAFGFEEALHSYFAIADIRQTTVRGLQGASYADKVRGMETFSEAGPEIRFSGETDRVYESTGTCLIEDAAGKRSLVIEKQNSASTVVWNPWSERAAQMSDLGAEAFPKMVCVESANVGKSQISLQPGEAHLLRVSVSVSD